MKSSINKLNFLTDALANKIRNRNSNMTDSEICAVIGTLCADTIQAQLNITSKESHRAVRLLVTKKPKLIIASSKTYFEQQFIGSAKITEVISTIESGEINKHKNTIKSMKNKITQLYTDLTNLNTSLDTKRQLLVNEEENLHRINIKIKESKQILRALYDEQSNVQQSIDEARKQITSIAEVDERHIIIID
jgi:chromosome segregation ATPase